MARSKAKSSSMRWDASSTIIFAGARYLLAVFGEVEPVVALLEVVVGA